MTERAEAQKLWELLVRCEGQEDAAIRELLDGSGVSLQELKDLRRTAVRAVARGLGSDEEDHPSVRVDLFGIPELRVGGRRVEFAERRGLEFVARLALAPERRLTRSALVADLWPNASEDVVRRSFHPAISAARRALRSSGLSGDPLPHRMGTWGLSDDVTWNVDVLEARGLFKRARALRDPAGVCRVLEEAWSLRRGELLEGWSASWVEEERKELAREYRDLLRLLGDARSRQGEIVPALDAYRALLAEDPLAEPVHVEVMRLYAELGRRDLVRDQFLRLQGLLAELEVEPARETQKRFRELLEM